MHQIHNGFEHSARLILTACCCLRAFLQGTFQLPHLIACNYFPDTWNIVICRGEMEGEKKSFFIISGEMMEKQGKLPHGRSKMKEFFRARSFN